MEGGGRGNQDPVVTQMALVKLSGSNRKAWMWDPDLSEEKGSWQAWEQLACILYVSENVSEYFSWLIITFNKIKSLLFTYLFGQPAVPRPVSVCWVFLLTGICGL